MFSVKIHRHPSGDVLAVCDSELLGQSFSEGKLRLKVGEGFYGGEEVDESILLEHMARAVSMNLVGEEAVTIAIREGYVDESRIIIIGGVKHAQVLR